MISQPPLRIVHPPEEVWHARITVRPFVVNHQVARDATHAEAIVRQRCERACQPQSKIANRSSQNL